MCTGFTERVCVHDRYLLSPGEVVVMTDYVRTKLPSGPVAAGSGGMQPALRDPLFRLDLPLGS